MDAAERLARTTVWVAVALGVVAAVVGSQGSARLGAVPVFALVVALIFAVQWLAFIPAWRQRSERFYDLTGGLTYLAAVATALALGPPPDARAWLLAAVVTVWAARLGTFLARRVRRAGHDGRFDAIKQSGWRFLAAWTLQGLWVTLTAGAALAALLHPDRQALAGSDAVGLGLWIVGFAVEVSADWQKARFRAQPENRDRFLTTGLWAWSRHPNYVGEIALWVGVAVLAAPALRGWSLLTLVSPVFVAVLLIRVSGVPLLEQRADRRWGGQPAYEAYKRRTPVLWPRWGRAPGPPAATDPPAPAP